MRKNLLVSLLTFTMSVVMLGYPLANGNEELPVSQDYNVGFQIIKIPRENEPLVIAVWYPTAEKPSPMSYSL